MRMLLPTLLLLFYAPVRAQDPPPNLDAMVKRVLETFEVPGAAVAIVKDGQTVAARGYGVRSLDAPTPVDADTLFGIASNTKAFTAASLALLVDEGLVDWDTPVIEYLPEFRMYDPYVSVELTVRDLLVHRSGLSLGAGDLLHWPETLYTPKEIVHRLRYIKPATSFRAAYAYDNVLYLVAGEVVERVSGKPWKTFVRERLFQPLGMKRACLTIQEFQADPNHVAPHIKLEGTLKTVPLMGLDSVAPAGAINASAREMTSWVKAQLAKGRLGDGDERLFSEAQSREMHALVTPIPVSDPPPELAAGKAHFRGYGLGWALQDYRGVKMVSHNGGLLGQVSRVTLLPDLNLGVVVLTNQQSGAAFMAITNHILDYYLHPEDATDWTAAYDGLMKKRLEATEKMLAEREEGRRTDSKPSLPLDAYAGTWRDAWYGDAALVLKGDALELRFLKSPILTGTLEHYQYDTFIVRWNERALEADAFVTFALDAEGRPSRMTMKAVSPLTDFSFNFHDLDFHPVP